MERINRAKDRLSNARYHLKNTTARIADLQIILGQSAFRRYCVPVIFAVPSAAYAAWLISQIPTALMDNGGNWAGGLLVVAGFVLVISVLVIVSAHSGFVEAPEALAKERATIPGLEAEVSDAKANLEFENSEYERRRALPDVWLTLAGVLGAAALRRLEEVGDADDTAAIELRAVIHGLDNAGWADLAKTTGPARVHLLREARAALKKSQGMQS